MNAITTVKLEKRYGSRFALKAVDLEIPQGSIYGLLGPNGAGKTTALETIAGLRNPTSGEVLVANESGYAAYCPDVAEFEPWLNPVEVLDLSAGLLGHKKSRKEIMDVLTMVGLDGVADRRVRSFSRGMFARLGLGAALVCDPEILLLDEPVAALDPLGQHQIMDLLEGMRGSKTVVISSHDLTEIEQRCDTVGVLNEGELIYQGRISDLLSSHARHIWRMEVHSRSAEIVTMLKAAEWTSTVSELAPGIIEIFYHDSERAETELPRVLANGGARLVSLTQAKPNLEQIFLSLTGGQSANKPRRD